MGEAVDVGREDLEISVPSQFCREPKTALKTKAAKLLRESSPFL